MAAASRKDLYLSVSGDVTPLNAAMKIGQTALLNFGATAEEVQKEIDRSFQALNKDVPAQAASMEQSLERTFKNMRRNLTQVLAAPDAASAQRLFDAGAVEQAAKAAETKAAQLRQAASAAAQVAARDGDASAAARNMGAIFTISANQVEQQAAALTEEARVLRLVEAEMGRTSSAQVNANKVSGQAKAGYQQLSYQLSDIATQYTSGASASLIFAQQSGQVIQALSLIAGEAKGVLGLLGGPWGIALTTAAVVLTPFVAKLFESNDELGKAIDKLKEHAHQADLDAEANRRWAGSVDGMAESTRKAREELDKLLTSQRQQLQNDAARRQGEINGLERGRPDRRDGNGGLTYTLQQLATARRELAAAEKAESAPPLGTDKTFASVAITSVAAGQRTAAARAEVTRLEKRAADLREAIDTAQNNLRDTRRLIIDADVAGGATPQGKEQQRYQADLDALHLRADLNAAEYERERRRIEDLHQAKLKALADEKRAASGGSESARGNTVATLKQIFPGIQIAHTTDGRHGPNSQHPSGHAIDFVLPGATDAGDFDRVLAAVQASGIQISRNRNGTLQFFGPGHGPGGAGDRSHDDHYHVGFDGARRPEQAEAAAAAARQRQLDDEQAYAGLENTARQQLIEATRALTVGTEERGRLQIADIEAERDRANAAAQAGVDEKRWSQAKADELIQVNNSAAAFRIVAAQEKTRAELAQEALALQRDDLQGQNDLLSLQADLATTAADRRRIALEILDNEEKLARATLDAAIAAENDPARKAGLQRQRDRVSDTFALRRAQAERQTDDPLQAYGRRLIEATGNLNDAFKGVKAGGLQELEDGLTAVIAGTDSVAGAFKRMVSSIIADLARIAAQKLIVQLLGSALNLSGLSAGGDGLAHETGRLYPLGGVGGGEEPTMDWLLRGGAARIGRYAGGGPVVGPGHGTSDDVLSWLSNGEFVMNADATRRYLPMLRAMNDNRLPGFAAGGLVGALPSLPSPEQLRPVNDGPAITYAPVYNVQGSGPELDALRAEIARDRAEFPARATAAIVEARKRNVLR